MPTKGACKQLIPLRMESSRCRPLNSSSDNFPSMSSSCCCSSIADRRPGDICSKPTRHICVRSLLCPASSYPSIHTPNEQIIKGHYHLEMVVMQQSSRQIIIMYIFLRLCPSHQELLTTVTIKPNQNKHTHTNLQLPVK